MRAHITDTITTKKEPRLLQVLMKTLEQKQE